MTELASTKTGLGVSANNSTSGFALDEVRLTLDGVGLSVDLTPNMIARIDEFINSGPEGDLQSTPYYKKPFRKCHTRHYRTGFRAFLNNVLAWEPTGASAFVCETGSKRPGTKNTRFSWNPSRCDSVDVAAIVFNDYLQIPSTCLNDSVVSSIHLAVDIPNARVDDQAFSYPKMRLTENKFSAGRTMYLGMQYGETRFVAYDKRDEIIKSNSKLGAFLGALKESVPHHDLLRIEAQLTPKTLSGYPMHISELIDLHNPFLKLRVHAIPNTLSRDEKLALYLARYEGLRRARHVAQFTSGEDKAFLRKLGKAGAPSWWKPEQIWEQQFPPLIDNFLTPFINPHWGKLVTGNNIDSPLVHHLAEGMTMP
jgi:hypothetical protein